MIVNNFRLLEDTLLETLLPPFQAFGEGGRWFIPKRDRICQGRVVSFFPGGNDAQRREGSPAFFFRGKRQWSVLIASNGILRLEVDHHVSDSRFEVDLVIEKEAAIEIKGTPLVQEKHLKGLRVIKEEGIPRKYLVISLDSRRRTTEDGIQILPWRAFLQDLWTGKIV